MFAHFGGVVAAAVWDLLIPLLEAGDLVPVDLGAEAGTVRHAHGAVFKLDAARGEDFVGRVLPGVVGVAGERHRGRGAAGMGHDEQAQAEVVVGVHREAEAEPVAEIAETLNGADAAPVVGIGKNDLDSAGAPGRDDILEAGDGDVGGQQRLDAFCEQAAADLGHGVKAGDGIFEIAAAREFLTQCQADADRRIHAPGAVWIDTKWEGGAEFRAELADGFDLDFRIEHAAFQFDFTEAVAGTHLAALPDDGFRGEAFAVLIVARIGTFAATAGVLVEEISGEGGGVASAAAEQVADGLADGLSDDVEAGGFDSGEGAAFGVGGIFAGDEPGLGAVARGGGARPSGPQCVESKGVHAQDVLAHGLQCGERTFAAVGFGDAGDAAGSFQADDGAEGVWGMESVGAAEGRIGDGERVDGKSLNDHGGKISRSARRKRVKRGAREPENPAEEAPGAPLQLAGRGETRRA